MAKKERSQKWLCHGSLEPRVEVDQNGNHEAPTPGRREELTPRAHRLDNESIERRVMRSARLHMVNKLAENLSRGTGENRAETRRIAVENGKKSLKILLTEN
jgi:hypothetical protein